MKTRILNIFVGAILSVTALAANAGLIGDTIKAEHRYSTATANLGTRTIDADGETFNSFSNYYKIFATDTTITADFIGSTATWTNYAFNGIVLQNLSKDLFPFVTLDASSNLAGFNDSRFWVTGNSLFINMADLSFNANTQLVFNLVPPSGEVPEPAMLGLLAVGLFGVAASHRRRKA